MLCFIRHKSFWTGCRMQGFALKLYTNACLSLHTHEHTHTDTHTRIHTHTDCRFADVTGSLLHHTRTSGSAKEINSPTILLSFSLQAIDPCVEKFSWILTVPVHSPSPGVINHSARLLRGAVLVWL